MSNFVCGNYHPINSPHNYTHRKLKGRALCNICYQKENLILKRHRGVKSFSCLQYSSMRTVSRRKNWGDLPFTREDWEKYVINNPIYRPKNTSFEFVNAKLSGYFNTPVHDRINDSLPYSFDNISVRPHFLNSACSFKDEYVVVDEYGNSAIHNDFVELDTGRYRKRTNNELHMVIEQITDNSKSDGKLYEMSETIFLKRSIMENTWNSIPDVLLYIIELFISQGGRCAFTGYPMCFKFKNPFAVTSFRRNQNGPFNVDNIILIVAGLNTKRAGQRSKHLSEEVIHQAVLDGSFNQTYWDNSTKADKARMDIEIHHDRVYLKKYLGPLIMTLKRKEQERLIMIQKRVTKQIASKQRREKLIDMEANRKNGLYRCKGFNIPSHYDIKEHMTTSKHRKINDFVGSFCKSCQQEYNRNYRHKKLKTK